MGQKKQNLKDADSEDFGDLNISGLSDFVVEPSMSGIRLDVCVAKRFTEYSREVLKSAIQEGVILLDGKLVRPSQKLQFGQIISVDLSWFSPKPLKPECIDIDVLYEDDDVLVLNKPAGLTVHPAPGCLEHTLVNALLYRDPQIFSELDDGNHRPGIVHRLDRDTSGVMVVGKNTAALERLKEQFQCHSVRKRYLTILEGEPASPSGRIETLMGKHPKRWDRRAVLTENGKIAISEYEIKERFDGYCLVSVTIFTGRTHQIRVHMSHIGAPVAGDALYGGHIPPMRQMLHAEYLKFRHPTSGESLEFSCPPPMDFQRFLLELRKNHIAGSDFVKIGESLK